jgi:hypothetical protein
VSLAVRRLPHYAADCDYTAHARGRSYMLYVAPGFQVMDDSTRTGLKSTRLDTRLTRRLKGLTNVKSTSNSSIAPA